MQSTYRTLVALLLGSVLTTALLFGVITVAAAQEQPTAAAALADLRINELMASNGSTLVDPDNPDRTPDWIELYNPTNSPVSVKGLAVTDDPARPTKHVITEELTIEANGFLILFADNAPQRGPRHLDFALSAQGEFVGIYQLDVSGNATPIDEIEFPALGRDVAYARSVDGAGVWQISRATPGKSNSANPPWISGVTTPTVNADQPAPTGPFTVTAVITDDVGVTEALVVFMTMTAPYTDAAPVWVDVEMTPVGGNLYQGVIPGMAAGTLVRYYVEASDAAGDSTLFPPLPSRAYAFLAGYQPPRLLINKVVSRNDFVPDPDEPNERPDWIELYNPTAADISLDGLSITNSRRDPLRFIVPNGIILKPGQLLAFLADDDIGQNTLPDRKVWHMNFRLENSGDYIGVYGGQGTIAVDEIDWDERPRWGAFGRVPNGGEWSDRVCVVEMEAPNLLCDKELFLPSVQR